MTDSNQQHEIDPLDEATGKLRDAPAIPGPSETLLAATVAAVDQMLAGQSRDEPRQFRRRKMIMRILKFGGLSASVAALVMASLFLSHPSTSAAQEVKEALRKVEEAKSFRMQTEQDLGAAGKMKTLSWYADGKMRSETEPTGLTVIVDAGAKKTLMLMSAAKKYMWIDMENNPAIAQATKSVAGSIAGFKIPTGDKVEGLPAEFLEGRSVKVYEINGVDIAELKGSADMKLWIDPKTGFPIKSRIVMKIPTGEVTTVATYLGFNEDLDPSLFDMRIPEGFQEMPRGTTQSAAPSPPPVAPPKKVEPRVAP
jgi:outer membrane lipoprotein-sorting protein